MASFAAFETSPAGALCRQSPAVVSRTISLSPLSDPKTKEPREVPASDQELMDEILGEVGRALDWGVEEDASWRRDGARNTAPKARLAAWSVEHRLDASAKLGASARGNTKWEAYGEAATRSTSLEDDLRALGLEAELLA